MEAKARRLAQRPGWQTLTLDMLSYWLSSSAFLTTKREEELFESKDASSSDRSEQSRKRTWI